MVRMMVNLFFAFLFAMTLDACSGSLQLKDKNKPCSITDVTVHFLTGPAADSYCRVILTQEDPGIIGKDSDIIEGCYKTHNGHKEVVIGDDEPGKTLIHEFHHLIENDCSKK
jgi:hypothetical protein